MSYYSRNEMMQDLNRCPHLQKYLYCRGFLITNDKNDYALEEYPFYSNWHKTRLNYDFSIYLHNKAEYYVYEKNGVQFFLIGHAYNPFTMESKEDSILKYLSDGLEQSESILWDRESELTGVFCFGFINGDGITFTTDACGMQLINYGIIEDYIYITSHSKLVSDMRDIQQDPYVTRLVNNKFWHYWGTWLPGDISPYKELKRLIPNCCCKYKKNDSNIKIKRYFPNEKIIENNSEEYYVQTIKRLSELMANNMKLIAEKWPNKTKSISVTGGRDSMTTLACTKSNYDDYGYFSYISNDDESVDAYAARDILSSINLPHSIISIPEQSELYSDIDVFAKILECNAGCIGKNNENDVKKRLYFCYNKPCDIEIKSWVNEIGRGRCYDRFNIKKFPARVSASYWRTMHKAYIYDIKLMKDTDKVFQEYLDKYYSADEFEKMFWVVFYHWEFSWAGGEGVFLTGEHRVPYEITIPFNNRKYLELMLTVPLEKRKKDLIPKDIIEYMNKYIANTEIVINDVSHTKLRAIIERIHLEVYSRIK